MGGYFIGIQGAARTGVLAACDQSGCIKAVVRTPPLSMRVNPDLHNILAHAISELANQLQGSAITLASETLGACIAMSGVFQESDVIAIHRVLRDIRFVGSFNTIICEDVWAVLAAEGLDQGAVIMASTGANVFVRNSQGSHVRIGGWGSELGDFGGGYHVGKLAIYTILDATDGRRPTCPELQKAILADLELDSADQVIPWYYTLRQTPHWRARIADIATTVRRLAEEENNAQAIRILTVACDELILSLDAAERRARDEGILSNLPYFDFILAGGLARNSRIYRERIDASLRASPNIPPKWRLCSSRFHPVVGALAFSLSGSKSVPDDERQMTLANSAGSAGLSLDATKGVV